MAKTSFRVSQASTAYEDQPTFSFDTNVDVETGTIVPTEFEFIMDAKSSLTKDAFEETQTTIINTREDLLPESQFETNFGVNVEHNPVFLFDDDGELDDVIMSTKQDVQHGVSASLLNPYEGAHNSSSKYPGSGDLLFADQFEEAFGTSEVPNPVFSFSQQDDIFELDSKQDTGGDSLPHMANSIGLSSDGVGIEGGHPLPHTYAIAPGNQLIISSSQSREDEVEPIFAFDIDLEE